VADLIEGLRNRNPAPLLFGHEDDQVPVFARDYDWREYDRVNSSIRQLFARVEEAWPQLLQNLDKTQYSFTDEECNTACNLSVGEVCETIVAEALSRAYYRFSPDSPGDEQWCRSLRWPPVDGFPTSEADLKAWCEKRKGKRLFELQIEVCESVIKVIPTLHEIPEPDQAKCIAAIKRQIETLKASRKPVLVDDWPSGGHGSSYTREGAEHFREAYEGQVGKQGPAPAAGMGSEKTPAN
jgi:hypothetical protein